jgi:acyl transferase domain-containing protein
MIDRSEPGEDLSPTKRALLALKQMQSKLEALEKANNEPIAIVGIGCRFPSQCDRPEDFWQLLIEGKSGITEVPSDRWDIEAYYNPDATTPGKMYSRYGGFVPHLQDFDAQFFRISPREAVSLDPQQRLLLEVSWEALERAGIAPKRLTGTQTGVFVGICGNDYWHRLLTKNTSEIDAYLATGNAHSMASGRLSYILGLTGPSISVDTACSSSLVAVHLAISSLRNRECDLAISAGVNRILLPEVSINFSKARMLTSGRHCKTFDAAADGFVRAEGCGAIVLKRLSDAASDGNNILAIILGSAVNHDGRSSGLTVPNGPAQQAVIRQALERSKIAPHQVSYIETHGTGTALGDPIEVGALGAVFGENRSVAPLMLGSVKTNIGHLEAAAGIASLIKVVLALQQEEIPPHLHLQQPNSHIDWEQLPIKVPTVRTPWTKGQQRIAGVSSFGFSGTNAHVVVADAPPLEWDLGKVLRPLHIFTLSAKTQTALKQLATRYQDYLATTSADIGDICFTANTGRSHFNHRLYVLTASISQLREQLAAFVDGQQGADLHLGQVKENTGAKKIAFVFAGMGCQYADMGHQLYQTQPTFRNAIDRCAEILTSYLDIPLLEILYPTQKSSALLNQSLYSQSALFALEYALYELWSSWGIQPSAVIGDEVGEVVAACVAGVFSLEDGLKLIVAKSQVEKDLLAFTTVAQKISYSQPTTQFITNLPENVATYQYWCRHPYSSGELFAERIKTLAESSYEIWIEISPKPILSTINIESKLVFSLRPEVDDYSQILHGLGEIYLQGVMVNWLGFDRDYARRLVVLPTYPFQRQRYWFEQT